MPIPYLGSKRKSAGLIYQTIKNLNPNASLLVDLFCGGFAVGEYFLKQGWRVIANDKNKYVVALLKKIIFEGLDEKVKNEFVTREKFYDVINNPQKYEDWYVGYIQCIWSFGNTQKNYLYGKEVEEYKKAGHELVVFLNPAPLTNLFPSLFFYFQKILKLNSVNKRRIALGKVMKKFNKNFLTSLPHIEQIERLQHLEGLDYFYITEKTKKINIKSFVEFYNKDYKEVEIPKEAVVYCDPPYEGRAEYAEDNFNHKEFWDYVRELSKTNKVYVSEYKAPADFKIVLKFKQNSSLSGGQNNNQPDECLFTYGKP